MMLPSAEHFSISRMQHTIKLVTSHVRLFYLCCSGFPGVRGELHLNVSAEKGFSWEHTPAHDLQLFQVEN